MNTQDILISGQPLKIIFGDGDSVQIPSHMLKKLLMDDAIKNGHKTYPISTTPKIKTVGEDDGWKIATESWNLGGVNRVTIKVIDPEGKLLEYDTPVRFVMSTLHNE